MRAAVYHGPGDVRIQTVAEPPLPGPDAVTLQISRAAICGTDLAEWRDGPHQVPLRERHHASGHLGPLILGHEMVGRVIAVGPGVTEPALGQRVVPGAGVWCGTCTWCRQGRTNLCAHYYTIGLQAPGGLAERVTASARMCVPVADACADAEAVLAQPLAIGFHAARRAALSPETPVLVVGAGAIGSLVVTAARALGAAPIVVVDPVAHRRLQAERLGAHASIDSASDALGREIAAELGSETCATVVEASGTRAGAELASRLVARGGRVVLVGLQTDPPRLDLHRLVLQEVDLITAVAHVCTVDLPAALQLLTAAPLAAVVVDRVIDLEALVADGFHALADGRAQGKVVVRIDAA